MLFQPRKNRVERTQDDPELEDWTIYQIIDLNEVTPGKWNKDRAELQELGEGSPVWAGFISGHMTRTPESCNCFLSGKDNNNFHVNIDPRRTDTKVDFYCCQGDPARARDMLARGKGTSAYQRPALK